MEHSLGHESLTDNSALSTEVTTTEAAARLWTGSDAGRIRFLAHALVEEHPAWAYVPQRRRRRAFVSLNVFRQAPARTN